MRNNITELIQRRCKGLALKALSIRQPWANLIRDRLKSIETRTWATPYRGPLLICSSRWPRIEPAGCAIAVADLVDCRPMTRADEPAACCELYNGAWARVLRNIRPILPVRVKGQLGLFECPIPPELEVL